MILRSPVLQVQITQIDYSLDVPDSLDNTNLQKVPVLRIYGASSVGKKCCLHIHQVYPYFFVEYTGKMNPGSDLMAPRSKVRHYIGRLIDSLNYAISLSIKRDPQSPRSRFVRAVVLVKGIHFYGFSSSYFPFLKIYIADPALVSRAVAIMQSGSIMGTPFNTFESHLNYVLQFLCDYGLYGCGWIQLEDVWQRGVDGDEGHPASGPSFKPSVYFRQSRMALEFDTVAPLIINRHSFTPRYLHHKLDIPQPSSSSEHLVLGVRELWDDERRRRIAAGLSPSPDLPQDPSANSRGKGGGWVAEARWWDQLRQRIEKERGTEIGEELDVRDSGWERWTMTTFESVEALWEDKYRVWKPDRETDEVNPYAGSNGSSSQDAGPINQSTVEVDEALLSSQELSALEEQGEGFEVNPSTDDKEHLTDDDRIDDNDPVDEPQLEEPSQRMTPKSPQDHQGILSNECSVTPISSQTSRDRILETPRKRRRRSPEIIAESWETGHSGRPHEFQDLTGGGKSQSSEPAEHFFIPAPEAVTKEWLDDNERRPMKRLRIALEPDTPESISKFELFPINPGKNGILSGTHHPRVFSAQAKEIKNAFIYAIGPPPASDLLSNLESRGQPNKLYQDPHYSREEDVPERPWEFAGLVYHLKKGDGLSILEEWQSSSCTETVTKKGSTEERNVFEDRLDRTGVGGWEYASAPPSVSQVRRWLKFTEHTQLFEKPQARSQATGPYGFKDTPPRGSNSNFCPSFIAPSQGKFVPNPSTDPLVAILYSFQDSDVESCLFGFRKGVILVGNALLNSRTLRDIPSQIVTTELDLLNSVVDLVLELDPDVIAGWEIQSSSWGYLGARGLQYGLDVQELIARATGRTSSGGNVQWDARTTSTFQVSGRHVLNLWKIMRTELELSTYTLENTVFHLLRRRIPKYAPSTLTEWYNSPIPAHRARLLHHLLEHTVLALQMLEATDLIAKTAEFARVFGVDFFSVISRGSQFKVESFMFRIAKPESFVLRSPNKNEPLVVLDFQSLYPSVMIAYNYCYSTCLGRVTPFKGQYKFGVSEINLPPRLLATLQDHITVAPNGIMYVKPEVRRGLLGRMLTELLDTRVMVKQAMKRTHDNRTLTRMLDARQLGLKYIANVTYGYTSATFSGRMPQFLVHILSGKTKEQAFRIGHDIADEVTKLNPVPIKLKFEKVYLPCVLMAKKRYVGFKYENPDDIEPTFDAKGIETVRRDGVPAQRKMTETALKVLFRTQDLSDVKRYCYRSWSKILENKVSIQDFIFSREVRMGTYSDKVPPPPGVIVAARRQLEDPNNEAQYGDRISYIIARGAPHERLVDRAVAPEELLDGERQLDGTYIQLVGADVRGWYEEMPRRIRADGVDSSLTSPEKKLKGVMTPGRLKIEEHFRNSQCILCRSFSEVGLCERCRTTSAETISGLLSQVRISEKRLQTVHDVCTTCTRSEPLEPVRCVSLDCPWLFQRKKVEKQAEDIGTLEDFILELDSGDDIRENRGEPDEGLQEGGGERLNRGALWLWDDTEEE
ncbi:hypothetical protein B0F90DRAFT_1807452 [Multifurca ochricompacta]|uniref:DNA polymerase zeta catalytic subunit n=1 Tax=Multifurca ochricompacta TaxID=376703 RepID=A0AAD4MDQ0_9AGAM|nr:hypothetical protein B0F90DRAFT_1807452 [Multifurca ochricompacta]